jgi:hypothetical protein
MFSQRNSKYDAKINASCLLGSSLHLSFNLYLKNQNFRFFIIWTTTKIAAFHPNDLENLTNSEDVLLSWFV